MLVRWGTVVCVIAEWRRIERDKSGRYERGGDERERERERERVLCDS